MKGVASGCGFGKMSRSARRGTTRRAPTGEEIQVDASSLPDKKRRDAYPAQDVSYMNN